MESAIAGTFLTPRPWSIPPLATWAQSSLEAAAQTLADAHAADLTVIRGDDLLQQDYPLVHAVGRACAQPPGLIDSCAGANHDAPKVTLVGKGVCFDSGGS